eukprot:gb/GECG01002230.1/.p1 GENE.gb/GECG01002230.1/~~gb/GECG01002230.1/.p1  ORF type:complete len:170 (+),score=8.78 gb/GECG01002230.1/:1-510(+)
MTFFSGILLFRNLPRETFSQVQSLLFPKYFQVCTFSGLVTVLTYFLQALYNKPIPEGRNFFRVVSMSVQMLNYAAKIAMILAWVALFSSFLNMIFVGPATKSAMESLHKSRLDAREELGDEDPDAVDNDPRVKEAKKSFGIWHGMSSLCNLVMILGVLGHIVATSRSAG